MEKPLLVSILVDEDRGRKRVNEPVTVGLPFPQGALAAPSCLTLWDCGGGQLPLQACTLARWHDGSVKWALLDFHANVEANGKSIYQLRPIPDQRREFSSSLSVQESTTRVVVNTGTTKFFLNRQSCKPFDRVVVQGGDVITAEGCSVVLTDESGQEYVPQIDDFAVETAGPLRATITARGELQSSFGIRLSRFIARMSFYQGTGLVAMQMTLHNPRAARHPGGLWDLGDEGSIYFQDLSLHLPLRAGDARHITWTTRPLQTLNQHRASRLEIYQDSSGGENWRSTNHVNRFGKVAQAFQGYRVTAEESLVEEGLRATPTLAMHGKHGSVAATIEKFWQNFPKAIEARGNELVLRLFPRQFGDLFELQGGEQKTHTIYLQFSGPADRPTDLGWAHHRLIPRAEPQWYASSKACRYLTPRQQNQNTECSELIETAIDGPRSFFARREMIDEYGWRHFGDLYADHEAVGHTGENTLVAHYNNQYDAIYGFVVQYLRTGDRRWFELMSDLAQHVIDIDIYHTHADRPAYNGGLFWHTDHYLHAGTATHRAYSKTALAKRNARDYGGGPSNEHNYTSGLLYYYYFTGNEAARAAVLSLGDWVINMDDGSTRPFGNIDRRATGLCSSTMSRDYHGPGRGAGNSINALLDAYVLTHEGRYFAKAEQLVRRCIHPRDNIQRLNLDDPESRWSYLVFLQALGNYLEFKIENGENDYMYGYARESLLHYAEWMLAYEAPYATKLDKVMFPTETWPAQDIRKSVVFHVAAKYATEPQRGALRQKADHFFRSCMKDLRAFPTCTLTRPLVLLLTNAYVQPYFEQHHEERAPQTRTPYDFGWPRRFKQQFHELYWLRGKFARCIQAVQQKGTRYMSRIGRKGQMVLGEHNG